MREHFKFTLCLLFGGEGGRELGGRSEGGGGSQPFVSDEKNDFFPPTKKQSSATVSVIHSVSGGRKRNWRFDLLANVVFPYVLEILERYRGWVYVRVGETHST